MTVENRVGALEQKLPLVEYRLTTLEQNTVQGFTTAKDFTKDEVDRVSVRLTRIEGDKNKLIGIVLIAVLGAVLKLVIGGGLPSV